MERKLIKQGLGGNTIYLPKKWLDRKGLKQGDLVSIHETDTNLLIGCPVKEKREVTVNVPDESRVKNLLTHAYRRGFDVVKLINLDHASFEEAKRVTKELLLGFDVTEKTETGCVVENISEPTEQKYDVLLRRLFLNIKEMQNIVVADFEKRVFSNSKEVEELRTQHDKFCLFCKRVLTKERYGRDPVLQWELLTFLMHVNHAYYYLYQYALKNKVERDSKLVPLLKELSAYFDDRLYNSYFKKDMNLIHKTSRLKNIYQYGKCFDLLNSGKNPVVYSYIREIFRLIQIGSNPIVSGLIEESLN